MAVFIAHEHVRDLGLPSNFILLPILVYKAYFLCFLSTALGPCFLALLVGGQTTQRHSVVNLSRV